MKSSIFMLSASLLASSPAFSADTWNVDKAHSEAGFKVRHLMGNVRGRFGDFEGTIVADAAKPEASTVEFKVKTASIDTDVADRDKHLRSPDFFDVEKFPEMTFKSSKVTAMGTNKFDVAGTLTIRGTAKQIVLPVAYLGSAKDPWGNERASFEAAIKLNRKDFGMVWNKTLDAGGLLLGDDVAVEINIEAIKKKPEAAKK